MGFIEGNVNFLDDKLVALVARSPALSGMPTSLTTRLRELKRAVEGNSALTDRLNDLLNQKM